MSAHRGVGTELGEVQKGQIGTDAVGDRLGQLDHWGITLAPKKLIRTRGPARGVPQSPRSARRVSMCKDAKLSCRGNTLVLSLGTSKTGERRYLIDLLETLPQAVLQSVLLVCDAGYVGYDLELSKNNLNTLS